MSWFLKESIGGFNRWHLKNTACRQRLIFRASTETHEKTQILTNHIKSHFTYPETLETHKPPAFAIRFLRYTF